MMMNLNEYVAAKVAAKEKLFVPYITAGDPDLTLTKELVLALAAAGSGIIELGVPFSDPVGDGPVNLRSCDRALKAGTTLSKVLALVKELKPRLKVPVVLFTYFNPLFTMGLTTFAKEARAAGVSGVLTVDLPPEEAQAYCGELGAHGLQTIFLASPTTSKERLQRINQLTTGFVYYVARTGVTGVQNELSQTLFSELLELRRTVKKPVVVGFGISNPEQVRTVAQLADGIVVGSALVRLIEENKIRANLVQEVAAVAKSLSDALG